MDMVTIKYIQFNFVYYIMNLAKNIYNGYKMCAMGSNFQM